MNAVKDKLIALVGEELEAANAIHPPFHSLHEGYAVMLEEVEEAKDALEMIENATKSVWYFIKCDDTKEAYLDAASIEKYAINLASEAIQVAAMARKFRAIGKGEDMTREEMDNLRTKIYVKALR